MSGKPTTKWLETMIKVHGSREAVTAHMVEIGSRGGSNGTTGGYQNGSDLARESGRKGGTISHRKPVIKDVATQERQSLRRSGGKTEPHCD